MKKSKTLSFLLSLSLLASMAVPGTLTMPAYAAEAPGKGMEINKTAERNDDGSYTITLEAYATGEKISTEMKTDIPTDIVLVLDQSGSMSETMNTYDFRAYTTKSNRNYYDLRHNGGDSNLYYPLEDGSYASVSVEISQVENYTLCPEDWTNDPYSFTEGYYKNRNNLYVKVGEEYQKVTLNRIGSLLEGYTYTYTFPDNEKVVSVGWDTSPRDFEGKGPLYVLGTIPEYHYTYTDKNGVSQTIGTSIGENTKPTFTLYERYTSSTISRLQALKIAVADFAKSVETKAAGNDGIPGTADDVNHRVAVVGFASQEGNGNNTELLSISGKNNKNNVGVAYNKIQNQHLKDVLQDMNTQNGRNMVTKAIETLDASGATRADLGMDMAKRILNANPVAQDEIRTRVVVFFTDGSPTSSNGFEDKVANAAIANANSIKAGGTSVYSVGVFNGADATSVGIDKNHSQHKENQFMQAVSSNNGVPQIPSYYLSASDSETLNNIFKQISDNIESGGSSIDLGSEAVIKDIISPQFQLPAGASANDITLKTYRCTGENQWSENVNAMGAAATVTGDQVSVTGFDFKENWCGTETNNGATAYRGNKLVISFKVEPKPGFLGGNNVPTNTGAGVYENNTAADPLFTFPKPVVDVDVKSITVTAQDQDVYLLQDVPAEKLKAATVKAGDVSLDLTKADGNYGLEPWQSEYVDITVELKDKSGNAVVGDLTGLTADSTYTVCVKVTPKTRGSAVEQVGTGTGNIRVYKPQLTFKDGQAWYGDVLPLGEALEENRIETKWLHDAIQADTAEMGEAPELTLVYTPDAAKISQGKINTKQDVPVDAGVKLGEKDVSMHTTFRHNDCDGKTCELPENYEFLLHINTCQLTLAKTGGAADEPYVFTVYKDGQPYSEVTIVGNGSKTIYELPLGLYTIDEDENWSWRYTANDSASAELTAASPSGRISCSNSKTKNTWLNGFSQVVSNVFGQN